MENQKVSLHILECNNVDFIFFLGIAYVEYEKESEAADAVLKLDNYVLKNQNISVAISNPPPRNQPIKKPLSLGSGKKETGK